MELSEFKVHSCMPQDMAVPPPKKLLSEMDSKNMEELSEAKQEQLAVYKRRCRKFKHSFYNNDNCVLHEQKGIYAGTT